MGELDIGQLVAPVEPVAPIVPVAPIAPVAPVEPVVPVEPTTPVEPVQPKKPDKPVFEPVTEDFSLKGMKYKDQDVEVTIPKEVCNLAKEKGIDVEAVTKELYSSENHTLTDETKKSLYDAFGKYQVDVYLDYVSQQNEQSLNTYKSNLETKSQNEKAAWDDTMKIMGGEDHWNDLSEYANENLTDAEIQDFNTIMEKGSLKMQQLMIADLYGKFEKAGSPVAPATLDLEEGKNIQASDTGGQPLTAAEFLKVMTSGEYRKNPQKYDTLRQKGIDKGI